MGKYKIENDVINEYLGVNEEFASIKDFCEWLNNQEAETDIKLGLKKMLTTNLLKDDKEEKRTAQNRLFKENVKWILDNCYISENDLSEVADDSVSENTTPEIEYREEIIPENDFDKVKVEFEKNGYKNLTPLEESELDYTDDFELREGGIINKQKKVQIFVEKEELDIDPSKILMVEIEGNSVMALGYLIPESKKDYTVVFERKEYIDYAKFKNVNRVRLVVFDKKDNGYSRIVEIKFKPFDIEDERPLCIDFGTSNTTAGSYGILNRDKDEAEIVKFEDVTVQPTNTEACLLPTIVYVEDCSDPNNIKYLFGYEARKRIEEEHYESKASVYYEIKRWLSSPDEDEEIRDNNNNPAHPKKKEIVKAYIDYVIEQAEQYFSTRFNKIHFSAPVKLKGKFLDVFADLYRDEKTVLNLDESIDEGIAIVYNKIIKMIYSDKLDKNEKSIMIMDCGGGTTDLASCDFSYKNTDVGGELTLNTCFENGNSNFGGNNITYRIMQLLKIKVAAMLNPELIEHSGEVIELINKSENDILGLIEKGMKSNESYDSDNANDDVYGDFLKNYENAESVIPTIYEGNEKYRGSEQKKKIKRNFYYLWRQAEQIKIDFYKSERVLMDFRAGTEDAKISITNADNYYLYVINDKNELEKLSKPFDKISITIKEINRVICGDIYALLVGLFQNGKLTSKQKEVDSFDFYKLSGQSCKISLFSDLIKEYIPGRKLRPAIEKSERIESNSSETLKLDCVLGCINYVKDQIRPEMTVKTNPGLPEIIYDVKLKGNHKDNLLLFNHKNTNEILFESSHKNTREYPIEIIGEDNIVERDFIFELRSIQDDDEIWSLDDIESKILKRSIVDKKGAAQFSNKLKEIVKGKEDDINIVFIVPAKEGYGFYIGQIYAQNSEDGINYYVPEFEYENFEDASKTFFDGRR